MKLCRLSELKEGDRLARAVLGFDYQVLLSGKTVLTADYIEKLADLGINEVYVYDGDVCLDAATELLVKHEVSTLFHEKVKNIMEKHVYSRNSKLQELANAAEEIVVNVMEEIDVVDHMYEIRERGADLYEHSISLCTLATLVSLKLRLDRKTIRDVSIACLLHDIGLRYMSFECSSRSVDEYNPVEAAEYYKHPIYGYTSLKDEKWISDIGKSIILYHHEHIDGSGFPLKMKESPLEAQIVAVCDAFDEMVCGICQKRLKVHEAIDSLRKHRGVRYNEIIVNILLEYLATYPLGTIVVTNAGETGMVIRQNRGYSDRPALRIIKDGQGNALDEEVILDLKKAREFYITDVLD